MEEVKKEGEEEAQKAPTAKKTEREVDPPIPVPPGEQFDTGGDSFKGNKGMMKLFMVMIAAVALSFVLSSVQMVSKADFSKNLSAVATDIKKANDNITILQKDTNAVPQSVTDQLTQLTTKTTQLTQELAALRSTVGTHAQASDVTSVKTTIAEIQGKLTVLQAQLNALQTQVASK